MDMVWALLTGVLGWLAWPSLALLGLFLAVGVVGAFGRLRRGS